MDINIKDLFNKSDIKERKELCLKMIDTFDDDDKIALIEEIDKRNIALRVKKVGGNLPLTHQLLIRNNNSKKYIESKITEELFRNARLLDDLLIVCNFWQVKKCTHPHYLGNTAIIFSIDPVNHPYDDDHYKIGNRYQITDVITIMEEFRQESLIFYRDDDFFVDKDKKKHLLRSPDTHSLIRRLAKEKKSTLV